MSAEDTRAPSTVGAVFRALNGIGAPGGPILYMLRMLTVTVTSATLIGAASGWAAQMAFGVGCLGFAVGSCLGFVGGTIGYWYHCCSHSLQALDKFPILMQLHLTYNFRLESFERLNLSDNVALARFKQEVRSSLRLRNWMITAWQSAFASIEEVERQREAQLVSELGAMSK